jgi:hypothetical protein
LPFDVLLIASYGLFACLWIRPWTLLLKEYSMTTDNLIN